MGDIYGVIASCLAVWFMFMEAYCMVQSSGEYQPYIGYILDDNLMKYRGW